jgi:hypothetical protein
MTPRLARGLALAGALLLAAPVSVFAQGGRGGGRGVQPPQSPKDAAPEDLTGYWVAIVTEDWRFRMITPPKGDYASVPLNAEARKVADAWDPAKDEAAGEACKSYGAAALMRVPGRLNITWADAKTLKIETDAGTQTRLFHFGGKAPEGGDQGWQGYSAAEWQIVAAGRGAEAGPRGGSLKVVTTKLKPGYLRKNGVPYSANTMLTEYYSRTMESNGDSWLIITTVVEDPTYLQQPFITSTHFKKQPDSKGWNPTPCSTR